MLDKRLEILEDFGSAYGAPRLTVVITTIDKKGRVNAAPFSYFTMASYIPPRVCFFVAFRKHQDFVSFHYGEAMQKAEEMLKLEQYAGETENTHKDTLTNLMEVGEFGVNIMPIEYLQQVQMMEGVYPHGVNELEVVGLTPYPSTKIRPPLIKEAKIALECVKTSDYNIDPGPYWITQIIGEGVEAHLDSDIVEGTQLKHERVRAILQYSEDVWGVCTDLRHQPRIKYPQVIPMPKPAG